MKGVDGSYRDSSSLRFVRLDSQPFNAQPLLLPGEISVLEQLCV